MVDRSIWATTKPTNAAGLPGDSGGHFPPYPGQNCQRPAPQSPWWSSSAADLTARMREGRFREDLFFRLSVISIAMPPLCERAADKLPLARRFLGEFGQRFGRTPRGFSTLAEDALTNHDFPGNIRELRNRVERAVALADGEWIGPNDLFPERNVSDAPPPSASLAEARDEAERRAILAALVTTGGDITQAAERLGVSRSTLFEKVRRMNIRAAAPPSK
ncbi:MAG: sigma-54-dependent Fis family transcriptional regulator [Alphaproteobacteria bacterium]|nr:sigma-54-dependent Fis family transcriptional regulator [Alphaproteobacteria bacterium]